MAGNNRSERKGYEREKVRKERVTCFVCDMVLFIVNFTFFYSLSYYYFSILQFYRVIIIFSHIFSVFLLDLFFPFHIFL